MDIAIAVSMIYEDAKFSSAQDYSALARTWRDERKIPTEFELAVAWAAYQDEQIIKDLAEVANNARLTTLRDELERKKLDTDERLELLIEFLVNTPHLA